MATPPEHPDTDQLVAFGMGQLDPAKSATIESHLDDCPKCCETLLDLKDDTFVALLRNAPQESTGRNTQPKQPAAPGESRTDGPASPEDSVGETILLPSAEVSRADLPTELVEHPRYHIVDLIGRGGMGDVYRAEHRLMNRTVALKVINRELTRHPQAVERFHREVQAAARLTHPNIVTAYDAEQAGDAHYLVMEHVEGTDLSHVVKEQGPLDVAQACGYIHQAAAGLQHAHERGMVHRDIKPHNLMVTPAGQIKILDFGLATLAAASGSAGGQRSETGGQSSEQEADVSEVRTPTSDLRTPSQLTTAGTMMGTPDFISPEQAGDARSVDIRSDIYSLGCTLYYLLTGKPPFDEGSVADRVAAHRDTAPVPIQSLRSDIPDELAEVIRRMVAKDPAERFQSPAEVADALAPFVDEHRTGGATTSDGTSDRGTRRWSWVAALLVPLLVGLAGMIYVTTDRGTLVIESVDDSVEIVLSKVTSDTAAANSDGVVDAEFVDVVSGSTVKVLRSGTYVAQIQGDDTDLELNQNRFVLKRGDKVLVRVTRQPPTQLEESRAEAPSSPKSVAGWSPPENPDPSAILNEAHTDVRTGHFETALSKLNWYYENALQIQPSQSGVRNSFALSYWMKLADEYPPALERLRELRDEARERVVANQDTFQSFQDFAAISAELGEVEPVVKLFKRLQQTAPETAKQVYMVAEPALIATKNYELCDLYIDPMEDVPRIISNFRSNRRLEGRGESDDHRRFTEQKMTNQSATLVALLVVNDREAEAREAAEQLKDAWDSETFHAAIDAALAGEVPEPWPPRFQVAQGTPGPAARQATRDAFEQLLAAAQDASTNTDWRRIIARNAPVLINMPLEESRGLMQMLVGLPDEARQSLLQDGYLRWKADELDEAGQAVVSGILTSLLEIAPNAAPERYSPEAIEARLQQADTGFKVLDVRRMSRLRRFAAGDENDVADPATDDANATSDTSQAIVWYLIDRPSQVPTMINLCSSGGAVELTRNFFGPATHNQLKSVLDKPYSENIWTPAATAETDSSLEALIAATRSANGDEQWTALFEEYSPPLAEFPVEVGRDVLQFLADLPQARRKELLQTGYLKWKVSELSETRRQSLQWVIRQSMMAWMKGSQFGDDHADQLVKQLGTMVDAADVGFAVVNPKEGVQSVVWYLLMPHSPAPMMLPVCTTGERGADFPLRPVHEEVMKLKDQPYSQPLEEPVVTSRTRQAVENLTAAAQQASTQAEWSTVLAQHAPLLALTEPSDAGTEQFGKAEMALMQQAGQTLVKVFAQLPEDLRDDLLESGYLKWKFSTLDESTQAAMREALGNVLSASRKMGFPAGFQDRVPEMLASGDVGFSVIDLEGGQGLVWYFLMPNSPIPMMLPILGTATDGEENMFSKSVYQQLGDLEEKPYSALPKDVE